MNSRPQFYSRLHWAPLRNRGGIKATNGDRSKAAIVVDGFCDLKALTERTVYNRRVLKISEVSHNFSGAPARMAKAYARKPLVHLEKIENWGAASNLGSAHL
jgi:hypothetical protein